MSFVLATTGVFVYKINKYLEYDVSQPAYNIDKAVKVMHLLL